MNKLIKFLIGLPILKQLNDAGLFGEIECVKGENHDE